MQINWRNATNALRLRPIMEVDSPWRKISRVSFDKLANGAAAEGDNDNANIPIVVPIAVSSYNYKKQ